MACGDWLDGLDRINTKWTKPCKDRLTWDVIFFDTAWAYAAGKSEQILGSLIKHHTKKLLRRYQDSRQKFQMARKT